MRTHVAAVTMVAFLMALWWPYAAEAGDKTPPAAAPVTDEALTQAKQHFEAGRNAYNAGDYLSAIREFKSAESLRPSPILAYNIGLANEKLGKKRVAVKYFRRYLEQVPNAQNRAEVDGRIAQLEQEIAAQPPPPPPPPAGQAGQAPPPPPSSAEQPGDMPPQHEAQPPPKGYDPYASTAPNNPPATPAQPQKKKGYWWVWLIVGLGAAALTAVIVALAVVYGNTSTVAFTGADHALMTNPRDVRSYDSRTPSTTVPLFHF
jgi:tetratricopeptide (TPR) repeat protein